jgi:hypothetical protein
VYIRGEAPESHLSLSKREFVLLTWFGEEAAVALRLLDHQEGKLRLGPIEYIVLCTKFLLAGHTEMYLPGDYAYVLMGLLQHRPQIDKTDTSWQAFCRVIMANESHQLLERLICHLTASPGRVWASADDVWGIPLWDIRPHCQIAGIGDNDTLIVDGAYAATIRWNALTSVHYRAKRSIATFVTATFFRSSPLILVLGIILRFTCTGLSSLTGLILIIMATIFLLSSPYLAQRLYSYSRSTHAVQPCFFGIEGYVPLDTLSTMLFSDPKHSPPSLRWSINASVLSTYMVNEHGECIGKDPTSIPQVATLRSMSQDSKLGEPKLFTLIDTGSMTVTLFMARRPPTVVLVCGEESGMQRALLCSFDCTTGILHRETVIRMETTVLDCMKRVGHVQLMPDSGRSMDY